jgi:hypothetical protein
MGLLYGRAGRLTALFGDFWPGQTLNLTGAPSSNDQTKAGRTFLSAQHTTAVVLDYCEKATGSFCLLLRAKF